MRTKMLQRRKHLELSQEQTALRTGMSRANYAHIERGRHEPSFEQMKVIAVALKVDPDISFFENNCDKTYQERQGGDDDDDACTFAVEGASDPETNDKV